MLSKIMMKYNFFNFISFIKRSKCHMTEPPENFIKNEKTKQNRNNQYRRKFLKYNHETFYNIF